MKKSDVYARVLAAVSQETEIDPDEIIGGGKRAEVVDARYIFVYILVRNGFYYREIARYTRITRQAVGRMVQLFDIRRARGGKIFEIALNAVRKRLENN